MADKGDEIIREYRGQTPIPKTPSFIKRVIEESGETGWGEVVAQTDGHVTVEKLGRAGEVAEQLEGSDDAVPQRIAERTDPRA